MDLLLGPGSLNCLLQETRKFPPSTEVSSKAHIKTLEQYEKMYEESISNSEAFWLEQAQTLQWFVPPKTACNYRWSTKDREIRHTWFEGGKINVSSNCLDRHLVNGRKDKIAILWQGDGDEEQRYLTFSELHTEVCRLANALKFYGIQKGDRVCIYMPMVPEAAIAMLACARIGAIHSVVFAGFSSEALAHRIQDSASKLLITANIAMRGGKKIPLKEIADEALLKTPTIQKVILFKRSDDPCKIFERDVWFHDAVSAQMADCSAEQMNADDPLCILYTSGSTGKPKGVVHAQAGYLLHVSLSHQYIFDIHEDDIYWCTADIGWVTGHSYGIYGPLANGCTTLIFEGTPFYPDANRLWQIVEKYKVSVFYTAPTVIRSLICKGELYPEMHDLSSLRILGTVGEPINPEAWLWYHYVIGKADRPIVDTWWQTETGGILISAFPGAHTLKPGSASRPFFGVEPVILREDGTECAVGEGGALCIRKPWPGMMHSIWGDHERFIDTYFSLYKDCYFSGDGCHVDSEGDYWLLGRMDDVVNVSGHRIGTAEVESALVSYPIVAEAAVVPIVDPVKGQGLYAFVTLVEGQKVFLDIKNQLAEHVRKEIGAIAVPDKIQFAAALPKTRSGKIMRRILKKIAEGKVDDLGDISTLADPKVIETLMDFSEHTPST